MMSGVKQTSLL